MQIIENEPKNFITTLNNFENISLQQMDRVKLMDRKDTKFVTKFENLNTLFELISEHYFLLQINGNNVFNYISEYYDTPDFLLYKLHHNDRVNRIKLRIRKYIETNDLFFEIKHKNNKKKTTKKRINIENVNTNYNEICDFVEKKTQLNFADFEKKISNQFSRITLVNKKDEERVTFDFNLNFFDANKNITLKNLAIIEIKQPKNASNSILLEKLKLLKIKKLRISKYCTGIILFIQNIKYNRFKKKIKKLIKISNANINVPFITH